MKLDTLDSLFISAEQADSKKLVIVLHGRGDSYEGFTWMPTEMGLKGVNYLMVNAPEPYFTGYSWYGLPPNQEPGILASRQILDKVMNEVIAAGWQMQDTVLFGFSQGCLMTFEWGGRTSLEFAGIVGISGYVFDEVALAKEASLQGKSVPRFVSHGTMDGVLPYDVSERQVQYLKSEGFNLTFKSYRKGHTIDERQEMGDIRQFLQKTLIQQE